MLLEMFGVQVPMTESFSEMARCAIVFEQGSGIAASTPEEARLDQLEIPRNGMQMPSAASLRMARAWLDELKRETENTTGRPWMRPLIGVSAEQEVSFEWWSSNRKLTIYFGPHGTEYIRVWGEDIDSEMDSGDLTSSDDFRQLWNWLRR
jgi:hypothetical protein